MSRLPVALLTPLVALGVLTGSASAHATSVTPVSTGTAGAVGAAVDPVAGAQAQVAALGAQAAQATADLTAGTEQLEQGQARLAATRAQAGLARAQADAAAARAAAARALLGRVVNAAYRTVRPDSVTLSLLATPGGLEDAVLADAALDQVQGNQDRALRDATDQNAEAAKLAAHADELQAEAAGEATALATQVAALTAQAEQIRTRLDAASAQLASAQAAAQAAAATPSDASGGGALCTGMSTAGYPNGYLPAQALCPLSVGGGQRLRADAAAAFNRMAAVHAMCVTDSYRSYGEQVDVYARKPGLAAVPGTSNHGLGVAVDLCGGVESFGTPAYAWMQANAATYGWAHPSWADPGGGRPEPWHWEYVGVGPVTAPVGAPSN